MYKGYMVLRSNHVLVGGTLLFIIFIVGCSNVSSEQLAPDGTDCGKYITPTQSKEVISDLNRYVEITNLCYGRDTSSYTLDNELASSGSVNDKCASQGYISVVRANQLIDVENKMIDDANRCSGGSNFPLIQHKDKFGEV